MHYLRLFRQGYLFTLCLLLLLLLPTPTYAQFGDCSVNPIVVTEMSLKINDMIQRYQENVVYVLGSTDQTTPKSTVDDSGCFWHFDAGSIYYTPDVGAYVVHGAIRDKYAALGWEQSALGYPVTDELSLNDAADGRISYFQYGAILWNSEDGAFAVWGLIWEAYNEMGTVFSALGYPLSDESLFSSSQVDGRFNQFEHGVIIWSPRTGAWPLAGRLYECWQDRYNASDADYFTFPTYTLLEPTDEYPSPYAWFSRGNSANESWVMWVNEECQSEAAGQEAQVWRPSSLRNFDIETELEISPAISSANIPSLVTAVPGTQPTAIAATTVRCTGFGVASRLNVGMIGRVTPGDANNLRNAPETGAVVGQADAGEQVRILDGSVCGRANGLLWWKVSNAAGVVGWTAEGIEDEYWLEPVR